jgi:hypothetical protein
MPLSRVVVYWYKQKGQKSQTAFFNNVNFTSRLNVVFILLVTLFRIFICDLLVVTWVETSNDKTKILLNFTSPSYPVSAEKGVGASKEE